MSVMKFLILNNQYPTREVHACRTTITKTEVKLWEDISNYIFFLMNEITLVLHKKPMLLSTKKEKKKEQ